MNNHEVIIDYLEQAKDALLSVAVLRDTAGHSCCSNCLEYLSNWVYINDAKVIHKPQMEYCPNCGKSLDWNKEKR